MKILAIGDFHGKFPARLQKAAKECDLILSTGDFADADKIRKIIFKHWTNKVWWEAVGTKKAEKLEKESFDSGLKILKKINSLNKKAYVVWGNTDYYEEYKHFDKDVPKKIYPGNYVRKIKKLKNIVLVDGKRAKINCVDVIGFGGYLDATEYILNPVDKEKKNQKKRAKRYKSDESYLKKLFESKKMSKKFIFLVHLPPYGVFDKVKFKASPMHGKHVGFEPYNYVIKKYKPLLCICGHMHEYQGIKKIGKTTIIATGPAGKGKAALIELEKQRIKRIKFLK